MSSDTPLSDSVETSDETSQGATESPTPVSPPEVAGETPPVEATSQEPQPSPDSEATPAVAESEPAATKAVAASAPTETPEASASDPTPPKPVEAPRRRLNPTVNAATAKAVPSMSSAASTPAVPADGPIVATPDSPTEAVSEPEAEAEPEAAAPAPAPVELPPSRDVELDANLEAEIDAAVSADETTAAAAAAEIEAQQADDDSEEAGEEPGPGTRIKGKVQSLHGDNVFFDIPGRAPGVVSARQFLTNKPPAVGDDFDLVIERIDEAEGLVILSLPQGRRSIGGNWDAVAKGQVVDCMVTKTNKGGLEVTVSSLRGFMPASQIDLNYVGDMDVYIGQKLTAVITEANPKKRNLVVSRRAFLDIARKEAEKELWKTLAEGQTFDGKVKTLKSYGAFIDIGGVDGFLHIGEISWTRLNHPSDVLSEGQEVQVQVVKLEREKKRISLGMKQLKADPWTLASTNYSIGSTVTGRVTRAMDFGAFVELEPGIEGLIHISELDYSRVNKVTDVLSIDQQIEVKVLDVDSSRRRIGLSLKQLKEKPADLRGKPDDDVEDLPPIVSTRKGPLKGGTGPEKAGGGLFGNPTDFT
ncbi:MAG: S1 RNA-binding domain-containing protein [Planctomycetaceae bacterium]|jgi:small subunit ribosomal protein S1|nr:S1 RNA-binding domain-containing protein [Planctomycetaceae bacterium]MBT6155509.1 S1 RNA-binding domain-containing protein [Planctomycetaceae bacterium]MBT6483923.1 S1 RNA-binding domain-containing protein [Planctomycetaceae bacterium]MBT6497033.1 S1 RNA-binding domain-containing protein [Planctomycetaceae bacterium]